MSERLALPRAGEDAKFLLAPSLGYFGGRHLDGLNVKVGLEVSTVRLQTHDSKENFLNLRLIEFIGKKGKVDPFAHAHVASQSSVQDRKAQRKDEALLTGKGIHSRRELNPWWEIRFDKPVRIERVRLMNRPDGWGRRSRTLTIDVTAADGGLYRVYDGVSQTNLERVLAVLSKVAGIDLIDTALLNPSTAELVRVGILAELAKISRMADRRVSARDWTTLLAFTRVWEKGEPNEDEWAVLAGALTSQRLANPSTATSVKMMSALLDSPEKLDRLGVELQLQADKHGLGETMLSRHGVRSAGILRQRSKLYIPHLKHVIEAMLVMGYEAMLCYGTLLGAVREGRFLAHDDDVDIMFKSKANSRAGVKAELLAVKSALEQAGFRVRDMLPRHLNMHIIERESGLAVDLFPCWLEAGKLQMHMDSMAIRGVSCELIFPLSAVTLEGEKFPAPADSEGFLLERYGEGWRNPDRYYDWPWKLTN